MIDVTLQERAAAYLLGELSPAETSGFERELAGNAPLRAYLRERQRELERLTRELPALADPPPAVRDRLLATAAADPRFHVAPTAPVRVARPNDAPPPVVAAVAVGDWWRGFFLRALGAALPLALLAAGFGLWRLREGTERENRQLTERARDLFRDNETLRAAANELAVLRADRERLERETGTLRGLAETRAAEVNALRRQLEAARGEMLAARDENVFPRLQFGLLHSPPASPLTAAASPANPAVGSSTPPPSGIAVWDPQRQQGLLLVENLPVPRADQDYQVWVGDPAYAQPLPSGVFHPVRVVGRQTLAFVTREKITRANQFMVTLERKGGVTRIQGPAVLESTRQ